MGFATGYLFAAAFLITNRTGAIEIRDLALKQLNCLERSTRPCTFVTSSTYTFQIKVLLARLNAHIVTDSDSDTMELDPESASIIASISGEG